ncbi:beta-tubulin 2 [Flagelloscypha sp. PMI_526]|nr:beta-tubulin 2 [Flagelloscypha sp. PMI_526]
MSTSREIISLQLGILQVGQAGNQAGERFWKTVIGEHGLDNSGAYIGKNDLELARIGVYFREVGEKMRYVPRSIQIDLENGVTDRVKSGPIGGMFAPDTFITGVSGAGNNWAKGFYTEGAELIDTILEEVGKQAEATDCLQGFQILQSLGGGTGAGLGTLLLSKLREEYPDRVLATFSILPSPKVSETTVEPYNFLLSTHQLLESSDLTTCIDNEALYDINARLGNKTPQFDDLNYLIAKVMCGVSTSLRFPGQLNGNLRKLATNLIPFPRLHFLLPSHAPIYNAQTKNYQRSSTTDLVAQLFDRKNLLCACDPRYGRYLTAATMFRGDISSREAETAIYDLQQKNREHFVEWIPDNVSMTMVTSPSIGDLKSGTCLSNTTSMQDLFKRSLDYFHLMYKRKAFLHWYTGEGMDEMEFSEAESNTQDLIAEYQQYQEALAGEDEVEYEEEATEDQ